jgi:thiamine pyrophosphokinase
MLAEGTYRFQLTILRREDGFLLERIIIFANGELPDYAKARRLLRADDTVICADGGTRHALALGLRPDLIVGDMDSAENRQLLELKKAGVAVEYHSRDKNATDLELALQRALALQPKEIIMIAALGGRLDQTLANLSLLADPQLSGFSVRLDDGVEEILLCRDQAQVRGRSGDLVSLIPWQGAASEVETQGLKWPLRRETLYPDKTRGVSNEMLGEMASVSIGSGLLLVVHRRQS